MDSDVVTFWMQIYNTIHIQRSRFLQDLPCLFSPSGFILMALQDSGYL